MNRLASLFTALILIFLLFSCQDMGLFTDNEVVAEIITPEDGILLTSSDEIPIELFFENETPSSFSITLIDADGVSRGVSILDDEEVLQEIPPLVLPEELEDGYYRLNLELFSGEETMTSRIMPFFLINNQPHIVDIISYPLVFYPGGKGLVFLDAFIPRDLEPWVRWSFEGEIIKQGPLSEGLERAEVTAPEIPGFYTLAVEIIPMLPPDDEDEWSFTSPLIQETMISVSSDIQAGDTLPLDSGSFFSLFHFQGEFNDWGDRDEPLLFDASNEPDVDVTQGLFGYRLSPFSGFKDDDFLFPVTEELKLAPFSLYLVFSLDNTPVDRRFLVSSVPGLEIQVETNYFGIPSVKLSDSEGELLLTLDDPLEPGVYIPVIISVYPDYENGVLSLSWYHEGTYAETHTVEWLPDELWGVADFEVEKSTELGGVYGGVDLIDELGVFYLDNAERPSVTADLYSRYAAEEYDTRLVYADGFDSLDLREELNAVAEYNSGEISAFFGNLNLEPEALLNLPGLPLEDSSYTLSLSFQDQVDNDDELFWLEFREETDEGMQLIGEASFRSGKTEISLILSVDEGLLFADDDFFPLFPVTEIEDDDVPLPVYAPSEDDGRRILVGIANRSDTSLILSDVLILSEPLPKEEELLLEYPDEF